MFRLLLTEMPYLGGLNNFIVLEAVHQDQSAPDPVFAEAHFLVYSLTITSCGGGVKGALCGLFFDSMNPIQEGCTL